MDVTSTAPSLRRYFIQPRGSSAPSEAKSSISGTVPSEKASISSAPFAALPEDMAQSQAAYRAPQGMRPVNRPTSSGV